MMIQRAADMEISYKNTHTAATSGKVLLLADYNARCDKASEGNQLLRPLIIRNSSLLQFQMHMF